MTGRQENPFATTHHDTPGMPDPNDYRWLTSDEATPWLILAAESGRTALQLADLLRRSLPRERAALVAEQCELRRRAAAKFGDCAERMFFEGTLLEQATDAAVGRAKARRIRRAIGDGTVHDLCCGLGGDLIRLAKGGGAVGYDRSASAAILAEANLRVAGRAGAAKVTDVETLELPPCDAWHIDPDRRAVGRRTSAVETMSPGVATLDRLLARNPDAAMKLAPAAAVPEHWSAACQRTWITARRECRQQVAWFGRLAERPGERQAVLVDGDGRVTGEFAGRTEPPAAIELTPQRFVFDLDPSVRAAGLAGALANRFGWAALGSERGYLTGDDALPGDAAEASPLVDSLVVEEVLPLRLRDVAAALKLRRIGRVELKKRGVEIDPESFRRRLKLHGDDEAVLLLARIGKKQAAVLARRMKESP